MMCGMDDQHVLRALPEWMVENLINPVRCLPPLGVHEWCEHDPNHPPPDFSGLVYEVRP